MNYTVLAVVLLYEIISVVGIGIYLARVSKKGQDSFLLSNRDLPTAIVGVTLALTVLGSAHVFGLMEMAWNIGMASMWFSFAHVALICVICLGTGRWVRRLHISTVPELIELLLGKRLRIAVACVMAGSIFGLLSMETQTIGIAFSAMTGWSIHQGMVLGAVLGILYVIIAGMKEIGWVNLVNTIVMYLGVIVAAIYLTFALPGEGWKEVSDFHTLSQGQEFMVNIMGNPSIWLTFALANMIAVPFAQGISQMALQTAMSAKSEKVVKKTLWIAAPINGMFGVFAVLVGLAAKSIPEFAAYGPKMGGPMLLVTLLPDWLVAWLLASFLGALLSTFAMNAMAPATIFVKDIYERLYEPHLSEERTTKFARIMIVILGIVSVAVAFTLPQIINGVTWLFGWLVPVFWVVIYALFWKRSTKAAGITLAITWVINLLWSFSPLPTILHLQFLQNAVVTFILAIVLGAALHYFMEGKPGFFRMEKEKQEHERQKLNEQTA
ncbi:sodium:solute symporter family protein [Metabacillus endolithicus]|uniref:Sodium:solute symporter n=1 Tax=Metabacillus endolithicus TaxID=1535204 RepID=A0ABW5C7D6_9BACI|nr:sodium:solute symporter family protein [Metabacillus endolithicus]UPG63893.1 sodium:solute symporter family protein [Metabacillus endolithicus]